MKESVGEPEAVDPDSPPPAISREKDKDGFPAVPAGNIIFGSVNGAFRAKLNASHETMEDFSATLLHVAGRPVFDATGLKGRYDFVLTWTPDGPASAPASSTDAGVPLPAGPDGPSLIGALQSQLGLKLESRKRKVDLLIIDSARQVPTEN
jgi:uncharacterized protein (TIGR03435 family)